jgi:hypothetical protein
VIEVSVDDAKLALIDTEAKRRGMSRSEWLSKVIDRGVAGIGLAKSGPDAQLASIVASIMRHRGTNKAGAVRVIAESVARFTPEENVALAALHDERKQAG